MAVYKLQDKSVKIHKIMQTHTTLFLACRFCLCAKAQMEPRQAVSSAVV